MQETVETFNNVIWRDPYIYCGLYEQEISAPKQHRLWFKRNGEATFYVNDHERWCVSSNVGGQSWCSEQYLDCLSPLRLNLPLDDNGQEVRCPIGKEERAKLTALY
jgi:hypothetical protein